MTVVTSRVRYIFGVLSVLLLGVVSLLVVPLPTIQSPSILAFLGRLHPIAVHFPIVLVPALTVFYLFIRQGKIEENWAVLKIGWLITVGCTIAAVCAGYLLYASGDYGGNLVQLHLQGSVVVTVLLLIGALLAFQSRNARQLNRVVAVLIAANVALIYTGHQGGSLTHGFARLMFYTDGSVWLEFWSPVRANGEGERIYATQLESGTRPLTTYTLPRTVEGDLIVPEETMVVTRQPDTQPSGETIDEELTLEFARELDTSVQPYLFVDQGTVTVKAGDYSIPGIM